MSKLILLARVLVAMGLLAMTPQARAEIGATQACAAHADVVQKLADRYGEVRTGFGLHEGRSVLEIFSSPATGTWTIVVTGTDGMACLLTAGRSWEQVPATAGAAPHGQGI